MFKNKPTNSSQRYKHGQHSLSYDKDKLIVMLDFGLSQSIDQPLNYQMQQVVTSTLHLNVFWNLLTDKRCFHWELFYTKMITGMHPWEYGFDGTDDDIEITTTMVITARRKEI
ncbi:MAG: hypothetical protein IPF81_13965 [Bacteroidetes bacterium]|nr:hypothetical protein [Bacteroidota bacterium]